MDPAVAAECPPIIHRKISKRRTASAAGCRCTSEFRQFSVPAGRSSLTSRQTRHRVGGRHGPTCFSSARMRLFSSANAQVRRSPDPCQQRSFSQPPTWASMPWQPDAPYVTVGQDERAIATGILQALRTPAGKRSTIIWRHGVSLASFRPGSCCDGERLAEMRLPPFEVPPSEDWPNVVGASPCPGSGRSGDWSGRAGLRLSQRDPEPMRGRTGERTPLHAGGRPGAAQANYTRRVDPTCVTCMRSGERYGLGLGFYVGLRFHVTHANSVPGASTTTAPSLVQGLRTAHSKDRKPQLPSRLSRQTTKDPADQRPKT